MCEMIYVREVNKNDIEVSSRSLPSFTSNNLPLLRFEKRIYIALPEAPARKALLTNLLKNNRNQLQDDHIEFIAESTDG